MAKLETAELARFICRQLYEFTDGRPKEWRKAIGEASVHTAVEQAVENGWLIVDDQDTNMPAMLIVLCWPDTDCAPA